MQMPTSYSRGLENRRQRRRRVVDHTRSRRAKQRALTLRNARADKRAGVLRSYVAPVQEVRQWIESWLEERYAI
jgi:hypothetical protein